ncbi:MAG: hypothetical protein WD627_05560 [Actinomycetota bacterium]
MDMKEVPVPDPVEMPDPESIPTKGVDTSTAFGNPTGRPTEQRLAELDDAPQSEEGAVVGSGTSFSKNGG